MQLIDKEGQYNSSNLLHQSQDNGRDGRRTEDSVSSPIASLDRHEFPHIPTKMPQTVEGVEGKRSSEDRFSCILDYFRKAGNELDDVSAVKGSRCHQVRNRETVEQDTKPRASDTVGDGT